MKNDKIRIVFAGGGTGGHIYPGLAVCDELHTLAKEQNTSIEIFWFGNRSGMDLSIVQKSGSADFFVGIPSGKLRRYFSLKNFIDIFKVLAGFFVSFFKLLFIRPQIVFSKGGFVSVPPCIAAKILRIPLFTHECDFTPGLATRINSRFASKILLSYPETKEYFPLKLKEKTIVSGNPVRPIFYNASTERGFEFLFGEKKYNNQKPILLVLGGSLGAHQINSLVVENLAWLTERFTVVHQCGAKDADFVPAPSTSYFPYPFIYSQMCDVIACADIVLSRSGANSIWECSVVGKPMVLIPLCGSGSRGDQIDNAKFFEKNGAAFSLSQEHANSDELRTTLEKMLDKNTRIKMAENSAKLSANKSPAKFIAETIYQAIKN